MPAKSPQPFPGFKHVCLFGLSRGGVDDAIRRGLVKYRGQTHKWLFHDLGRYCEFLDRVERGQFDCDLLVGKIESQDQVQRLLDIGKPVLDLSQIKDLPEWRTHAFDYHAVGKVGAQHLLDLRHRHFAFLTFAWNPPERAMWEGFQSALQKHAQSLIILQREEKMTHYVLPERRSEQMEKIFPWFADMPRPLAVLVNHDMHAVTLAELAFFSGVSAPEELCILGVGNDLSYCETALPSLSSVELPGERLGWLVGEHVEALLGKREAPDLQRLPPTQVVVRRSSDLAKVDDPIVARALAIMQREAASRMSIAEIIDQLPVSKRSFNGRFLNAVGRTPREELFRIRLDMAKERLLQTNQTVLHVAMDCGFADTESMARMFKAATGQTPTQFRRRNRL